MTAHRSLQARLSVLDFFELLHLALVDILLQFPSGVFIRQRAPLHQVVDDRLKKGVNQCSNTEGMMHKNQLHSSSGMISHLAIVLVHTVGNIQDPVHLHIVWVKRLLVLQRTTQSDTKAESYNSSI